jgi:hypothetical protein
MDELSLMMFSRRQLPGNASGLQKSFFLPKHSKFVTGTVYPGKHACLKIRLKPRRQFSEASF